MINILKFTNLMGGQNSTPVLNEELPGTKLPGFTSVYRKKDNKQLLQYPSPNIHTMKDLMNNTLKEYGSRKGIGKIVVESGTDENGKTIEKRSIVDYTYEQIITTAKKLGKSLYSRKLQFREALYEMDLIGIYSKNRYEWFVTDWACVTFGFTTVPLYDTLGIENLSYCLNQTQLTTLFVSGSTIKQIINLKSIGKLKTVILYDRISEDIQQKINKIGLQILYYEDLIQEGAKLQNVTDEHVQTKSDQCFTFSYTSGTTGPPKGVMISHKNMLCFIATLQKHPDLKFQSDDKYISYLPLPHLMQRSLSLTMFLNGTLSIISSGNMLKLKEDCMVVKPTIFISVPRVFNRMVESIKKKLNSEQGVKKKIIDAALNKKINSANENGGFTNRFYDPIIFSKVRQSFGGRIRIMATGSAPTSPQIQTFMKSVMCCPLIEAYGQTEGSVASFFSTARNHDYGSMELIGDACEVKLCDIPEMNYTSQDKDSEGRNSPRGQIWLRGPQVFMGYYKLAEQTKQAISQDGWLKTGDVGQIIPGTLAFKVIDRKKNIFKLQQGEYIAPQKIESKYLFSNLITEIFLHGQPTFNFAVAIATPSKQALQKLAQQNNIEGNAADLCSNKEIRRLVLHELNMIGKKAGLFSFEMAKNIHLDLQGFASKGIMTNTLKIIRFQARKCFKEQIEQLYQEGQLK